MWPDVEIKNSQNFIKVVEKNHSSFRLKSAISKIDPKSQQIPYWATFVWKILAKIF